VRRSHGHLIVYRPGWLHRGTWRAGQTNGALFVIQLSVLLACLTRGLDYLRRDSDPTSVLSRVQDSAPLAAWGAMFVAAVVVVAIGLIGRWGVLVGVGHIIAGLAYAGIAYGLFLVTHLGPGVRTPMGLAVAAAAHGALGIGTFAILRRREELQHPSTPT